MDGDLINLLFKSMTFSYLQQFNEFSPKLHIFHDGVTHMKDYSALYMSQGLLCEGHHTNTENKWETHMKDYSALYMSQGLLCEGHNTNTENKWGNAYEGL